ncbi:MAG: phytanoyl-CoA dioxygenase family protein [Pseudomonadales bacterium]|tara:strand:+ start:4897 stop:5937 length:1041 start_codon:yes stop_codon:yes gene_type:complete
MNKQHFEVTEQEWREGSLSEKKLELIQDSFNSIGFAVVSGLVPASVCKLLVKAFLEDVALIREKSGLTMHEKHTAEGHLQLGPRRHAPYVQKELVANPILESVVTKLLGRGAWLGFYNGNVNCPNSGYQPLHFDRPYAWTTEQAAKAAGQSWPPNTTTVSCSLALSEITEAVGATEIYPGSHRETAVTTWSKGEQPVHHPEAVAKWSPPASMTIPTGGVCFRDPRMWHRGVKNPSSTPRPMVALTYHSTMSKHQRGTLVNLLDKDARACELDPSLKMLDSGALGDGRLVFDADVKSAFDAPNLHGVYRNARFVDAPLVVNHFLDAHLLGGGRVVEHQPVHPYPNHD